MSQPWHLLDTNILLRLGIQSHADFPPIRAAIQQLQVRQTPLAFTFQNMTEFWNVATRPLDRNGFGLTIPQVGLLAQEFENVLNFLPDTEAVYQEWRKLVTTYEVKGSKVHDARLVAMMRVYGIRHLVTLNAGDFERYSEVIIVRPQDLALSL